MIEPRIDKLLVHTATDVDPPSRYALVIMAATRMAEYPIERPILVAMFLNPIDLARLVMLMLGLPSIREATFLHRGPNRLTP